MKPYAPEYYKHWLTKQWRWRVTADNGKIIGASSESFKNRLDCIANAENLGRSLLGLID